MHPGVVPQRWAAERSFAWAARFRRLARDYERLAATLGAFLFLASACLMLATLFKMLTQT
jgi:transposase